MTLVKRAGNEFVFKRFKHAAVVGGGLAGLACASLLARQHYKLTIFDEHPGPGIGNASSVAVRTSIVSTFRSIILVIFSCVNELVRID